jgi:hypothetical protein
LEKGNISNREEKARLARGDRPPGEEEMLRLCSRRTDGGRRSLDRRAVEKIPPSLGNLSSPHTGFDSLEVTVRYNNNGTV